MPKLTVDRYRFCKIENAVEMLSDGYNRFCSKQVFSKSDISAQNGSDVRGNIETSITQKLTSQHWSRLVLPLVSGFSMDRRHAFFACVHSVFVPILVPRARRFLVTWSYGYEILAILDRNRVWLSRELPGTAQREGLGGL